jgi:hypothetical protein
MKNMVSNIWETMLWLLFVLFLFTLQVSAQPPAPALTIVQPYYNDNGPLEMYLQCEFSTGSFAVEGIRFCKKVDNGSWGAWEQGTLVFTPLLSGYAWSCIDNSGLLPDRRYTYQVQLKVRKAGSNIKEWTRPSNLRSNGAIKIWPVTTGNCSEPDSINLLHGFNHVIEQIGRRTLHEGIDLTGEKTINGECVMTPMGGILRDFGPQIGSVFRTNDNQGFWMNVHVNGEDYRIGVNHLENVTLSPSDKNKPIEAGIPLGEITSTWFSSTEANHVHISWKDSSINILVTAII